MSCALITGSEACFHLGTIPTVSTRKSKPESSSSSSYRILFRSIKATPSGRSWSARSSSRAAAINNWYGSTAPAREKSFYELLGVPESGTLPEIKKAYKQLALKYHPDVSPPERTEENTRRFICVQEAYETLSNPKTRAVYDRDLAKGLNLASSKRRFQHDQKCEEWGEWRDRWQSQVMELNRRSGNKEASWGARMRRQAKEKEKEKPNNSPWL